MKTKFWTKGQKERDQQEELHVDERIEIDVR
jgi:hypothetical protein